MGDGRGLSIPFADACHLVQQLLTMLPIDSGYAFIEVKPLGTALPVPASHELWDRHFGERLGLVQVIKIDEAVTEVWATTEMPRNREQAALRDAFLALFWKHLDTRIGLRAQLEQVQQTTTAQHTSWDSTPGKLDELRTLRSQSKHGMKVKLSKMRACQLAGIDRKTVIAHDRELWDRWNDPEY
jgi:hypothetical protein